MKGLFSSIPLRIFVFALLGQFPPFASAEEVAPTASVDWKQVLDRVGLLPDTLSPYGGGSASNLSEQIGRDLTEKELALLARDDTGDWKEYSDGFIRFDLPDDPLIKVEAFEPEQKPRLEIVGGAVGSTDKHFQKVYRITFSDGVPYGLVLVSDADWFDEGICLCGPIDLKTFVHTERNLLELSQLPDGAIKKSQVINGSHRAILFEWTHSSITQGAYARIAASVRFEEKSDRSLDQWIAFSKKQRGFEAGLGWLYPDTSLEAAPKILGEPSERSGNTLIYKQEERDDDGRGSRMTYTLDFPNGKLSQLKEGWDKYEELDAPRGTLAWCEDTIRIWTRGEKTDDPFAADNPKEPVRKDVDLILAEFHKHAPDSSGAEWSDWSSILADLKRLKISDEKAAQLVVARSTDMSLPHHHTRWILELYELPEAVLFVKRRLRYLMDLPEKDEKKPGEIHNLFASLDTKDEEMANLLREGIANPNPEFRKPGVFFMDKLPEKEARSILRISLIDEDRDIRWSAILNVQDLCTEADKPWLEEALKQEQSEENRKLLEEKISQLK